MRLSQLLISDQRFPLYGYLQGSKWDSECRSGCLHVKFSYCCQRSWILKEKRSEKRKRGSYCCYFVFVWHEWKSLHSFIFVIENRKTQNRCSWTRDYILPAAYITHNAAWLLTILSWSFLKKWITVNMKHEVLFSFHSCYLHVSHPTLKWAKHSRPPLKLMQCPKDFLHAQI